MSSYVFRKLLYHFLLYQLGPIAMMFSVAANARIEMTPVPTRPLPLQLKLHVVVVCSGTEIWRLARQIACMCDCICVFIHVHILYEEMKCEYVWDLYVPVYPCLFIPVLQICVLVWRRFFLRILKMEKCHIKVWNSFEVPQDLEHRTCIPILCSVLSAIPITSCYNLLRYLHNPCIHLSLWTWFRYSLLVTNIEYLSCTGH